MGCPPPIRSHFLKTTGSVWISFVTGIGILDFAGTTAGVDVCVVSEDTFVFEGEVTSFCVMSADVVVCLGTEGPVSLGVDF